MLTSICVTTYNRTDHLVKTLQAIAQYAKQPYEVVAVDDCSSNKEVVALLEHFQRQFQAMGINFRIWRNRTNEGAAAANNEAWSMAKGDVIFHMEDDIVVAKQDWNQIMASFLDAHPEVGQVLPDGSGREEWIPRESASGGYKEFQWGLGGFFGIRRAVYEKVGGWDEALVHQIEPDYNLRVRMAGWRVAEVPGVRMEHLGEGYEADTFRRQAQITVGVHTMLGKWNRRFVGWFDYDGVFSMNWGDFPPNVIFRRQLAAWFAAEASKLEDRYRGLGALKDDPKYVGMVPPEIAKAHADFKRCELNGSHLELPQTIAAHADGSQTVAATLVEGAEPFQFPGHWGRFELVKYIRNTGREREKELINLMKGNYHFHDIRRVERAVSDLAKRMNHTLAEGELEAICAKVPLDIRWEPRYVYG